MKLLCEYDCSHSNCWVSLLKYVARHTHCTWLHGPLKKCSGTRRVSNELWDYCKGVRHMRPQPKCCCRGWSQLICCFSFDKEFEVLCKNSTTPTPYPPKTKQRNNSILLFQLFWCSSVITVSLKKWISGTEREKARKSLISASFGLPCDFDCRHCDKLMIQTLFGRSTHEVNASWKVFDSALLIILDLILWMNRCIELHKEGRTLLLSIQKSRKYKCTRLTSMLNALTLSVVCLVVS